MVLYRVLSQFGPMGWNRAYPYNPGDLKDSIAVANNYLEGQATIPWDDLRYLFGEIFYGGHISTRDGHHDPAATWS